MSLNSKSDWSRSLRNSLQFRTQLLQRLYRAQRLASATWLCLLRNKKSLSSRIMRFLLSLKTTNLRHKSDSFSCANTLLKRKKQKSKKQARLFRTSRWKHRIMMTKWLAEGIAELRAIVVQSSRSRSIYKISKMEPIVYHKQQANLSKMVPKQPPTWADKQSNSFKTIRLAHRKSQTRLIK